MVFELLLDWITEVAVTWVICFDLKSLRHSFFLKTYRNGFLHEEIKPFGSGRRPPGGFLVYGGSSHGRKYARNG